MALYYRKDTKTVLYRSKMNPNLKRNFAVFPVLDWIAEITAHIPNKGEQLVRYYGVYSNVSRGKRKKEGHKKNISWKPEFVEVAPYLEGVKDTLVLLCPQGLKWVLALPLRRPITGCH